MTTDYKFIDALLPPTYMISGFTLKPLSLGHVLLLRKLDNVFMTGQVEKLEGDAIIRHIISFLTICSYDFDDAVELLNTKVNNHLPNYVSELKRCSNHLKKFIKKHKGWNLLECINNIKTYIEFYNKMPIFEPTEKNQDKPPSGIEWEQHLYNYMLRTYGYSQSTILKKPFRLLCYEWCAGLEADGALRVMNGFEQEQIKKVRGY